MLLIDSFKSYASVADMLRTWDNQRTPAGLSLLNPGLRMDGTDVAYNGFTFPYALERVHVGFHFTLKQHHGGANNLSLLHLNWNGATNAANQVGLAINSSGQILVFRGSNIGGFGGTTLATGATQLQVDQEYWIEFDLLVDASAGAYDLRIDGVAEVSASGVNTDDDGSGKVNFLQLAAGDVGGVANIFEFRDFLADDCLSPAGVVWYGPGLTVDYATATADSAVAFTPASGADNYAMLAAPNASPTTAYVATSDTAAEDLYDHGGISVNADDIPYVQLRTTHLAVTKFGKALQPRIKVGADYHDERPARLVPETLSDWRTGWAAQPDGSGWTQAAINAAKIGFSTVGYLKGWSFRQTSAYLTDAAHCTYGILSDLYPVTRNGVTFGWDVAPTSSANRTSLNDPRIGGAVMQENTGTQRNFRIDLPAAGRYQVRLLLGDRGLGNVPIHAEIYDDATLKVTLSNSDGLALAEWNDAGFDLGTRNPPADTTPAESQIDGGYARWIDFASSTFYLRLGSPSAGAAGEYSPITHLELMSHESGSGTAAPEARVSQLALEVLRGEATPNTAPVVDAGADQAIRQNQTAQLAGTVTDDGLPDPPAALTYAWSTISGPGSVTFGSASSLATSATFSAAGTYVLRLTASDGELSTSDDVTITVGARLMRRLRTAPHIAAETNQIGIDRFRLDLEVGVGLASGQGEDPQLMLRWSDDGGQTFGNEHWTSAGRQGRYKARAQWFRLGAARDRVFELTVSDPVPFRILGAYLETRGGRS